MNSAGREKYMTSVYRYMTGSMGTGGHINYMLSVEISTTSKHVSLITEYFLHKLISIFVDASGILLSRW